MGARAGSLWRFYRARPYRKRARHLSAVEEELHSLFQWLERSGRVLGKTSVLIYPTNLFIAALALGGGQPIGLLDPENHFKATFTPLGEKVANLQNVGVDHFEVTRDCRTVLRKPKWEQTFCGM